MADELSSKKIDLAVTTAKITAEKLASIYCPKLGGIVGELIGSIIPGQRIDRIARFLSALDEKVASLTDSITAMRRLMEGTHTDLFEDAMFSACRSTTAERTNRIAALVGNSLSSEHLDALRHRRLLR